MVNLVIVSHSARLGEGVGELARQMLMNDGCKLAIAAGIDDPASPIGTDPIKVMEAIESVADADHILVMMDIGSALLSAETALDLLDPAIAAKVRLCAAPLVARGDAQELGCEIIKIFPGSSVGGPDFVKSVMGPMPWTRIMPTGGVEPTEESLRKWFGAGIVACGIGSNLITKKLLDAKDYQGIEENFRQTIALVNRIKADLAGK